MRVLEAELPSPVDVSENVYKPLYHPSVFLRVCVLGIQSPVETFIGGLYESYVDDECSKFL